MIWAFACSVLLVFSLFLFFLLFPHSWCIYHHSHSISGWNCIRLIDKQSNKHNIFFIICFFFLCCTQKLMYALLLFYIVLSFILSFSLLLFFLYAVATADVDTVHSCIHLISVLFFLSFTHNTEWLLSADSFDCF